MLNTKNNNTARCGTCEAYFPREWIEKGKYGASQVGVFFFCCEKCRENYMLKRLLLLQMEVEAKRRLAVILPYEKQNRQSE
jgi:hypothetical protein